MIGPREPLPQAPHVEGLRRHVVTFSTFARCLDCHQQTRKVRGKFNFPYLRRQDCRPLNKTFARRTDPPVAVLHPEVDPQDWHPAAEPLGRHLGEEA
eukprot:2056967-Amphidinium_carterae.2